MIPGPEIAVANTDEFVNEIDRRHTLGLLLGAGASLALSGCSFDSTTEGGGDASAGPDPIDTIPTTARPEPADPVPSAGLSSPELEDTVRDLALKLWAEPASAEIIAGMATSVYSFGAEVIDGDPASVSPSASYLGPTLHLRTGQRVRISFENRLDEASIVHWHGLVVPQDQDGQPADAVGPGGIYEYDFVVENEPGTYWYHPHPHGRTGEQVYRGLAGLLIVHGDEPALPSGDNDISLVLQDRDIDPDGQLRYVANMHDQMAGFVGATPVTNGVADLTIEVRREPYRVRLLNGANSRTQHLTWSNGDSITAVATDGTLLPEAETLDAVVLTPAQRTDLWVDFSSFEPGDRIELLSADTFVEAGPATGAGIGNQSGGQAEPVLALNPWRAATFAVVDSVPKPGLAPTSLGAKASFGPGDAVNPDAPKQFTLSTRRRAHWMNGRQWEGRVATDAETVKAGTVELWEFVNHSPMAHPMHLHGRSFVVTERSWEDDSAASSWAVIESGVIDSGLRDTVLVWPGQRVQIAIPFAEHLGYFMYHCHILEHEDAGMMRNYHAV